MNAFKRHLKHARTPKMVWTESEILSARMSIHRLNSDEAWTLIEMLNETGGYSITEEQSDKGISYLRSKIFNLKGEKRNSAYARCFNDEEIEILRDFKEFTFEGVRYDFNHYCERYNTSPIYRVHSKGGGYFDYTQEHFGLPKILKTHSIERDEWASNIEKCAVILFKKRRSV